MTKTILHLVTRYAAQLASICPNIHDAEQEVWWFIEQITGKRKTELLVWIPVDERKTKSQDESLKGLKEQLDHFIHQRVILKKPLQYILGNVPFGNLTILVEPPILIPRPETEEWTLWIIDQYKKRHSQPHSILDLCTGTGCIGLQLAQAFPESMVTGIDINPQAIALAEKNKALNAINNITFLQGNLFEPLKPSQTFDLIVSNPPYLAHTEWENLTQEVTQWEDKRALIAEQSGMEIYERIFAKVKHFLTPSQGTPGIHPRIIMEIGPSQAKIEQQATLYGFNKNMVFVDVAGKRRWLALYV